MDYVDFICEYAYRRIHLIISMSPMHAQKAKTFKHQQQIKVNIVCGKWLNSANTIDLLYV